MEAKSDIFAGEKKKAGEEENVINLLREYIRTRIEIGKLSLLEKAVVVVADLITDTFVVVAMILVFLFGSATLAFYFAEQLGSNAAGFGIVSLIYLSLALIMHFTKDRFVEKFLIGFMLKRITARKKK